MFNDLSFLIGLKMMIFAEAQSTFSVKLAIRLLLYYAVSLKEYIDDMEIDLYSDSRILGYRTKKIVDGKVKGRAEGENKLRTLFKALENAGRKDDAFKAASDSEYLQKLYEEFGIE